MDYNLSKLQQEVGEWADGQFPQQPVQNPLLGSVEESGELAEEFLSSGFDRTEVMDAIGDMVIYLCDFAYQFDVDLGDAQQHLDSVELQTQCSTNTELTLELSVANGKLINSFLKQDQGIKQNEEGVGSNADIEALAHILKAFHTYCDTSEFTVENCIDEAWSEVSDRDFDSSYDDQFNPY